MWLSFLCFLCLYLMKFYSEKKKAVGERFSLDESKSVLKITWALLYLIVIETNHYKECYKTKCVVYGFFFWTKGSLDFINCLVVNRNVYCWTHKGYIQFLFIKKFKILHSLFLNWWYWSNPQFWCMRVLLKAHAISVGFVFCFCFVFFVFLFCW